MASPDPVLFTKTRLGVWRTVVLARWVREGVDGGLGPGLLGGVLEDAPDFGDLAPGKERGLAMIGCGCEVGEAFQNEGGVWFEVAAGGHGLEGSVKVGEGLVPQVEASQGGGKGRLNKAAEAMFGSEDAARSWGREERGPPGPP